MIKIVIIMIGVLFSYLLLRTVRPDGDAGAVAAIAYRPRRRRKHLRDDDAHAARTEHGHCDTAENSR